MTTSTAPNVPPRQSASAGARVKVNPQSPQRSRRPRLAKWAVRLWYLALTALIFYGAAREADQSYLQSALVSRIDKDLGFTAGPGASPAIRYPKFGPYDERLGYVELPSFIARLRDHGFVIERQARQSPLLMEFMADGGYAPYDEKTQAGLSLFGRSGAPLYTARHPRFAYESFRDIPPVLVNTLRFIEDRDLLDPARPYRNPAVEWRRFALAAAGQIAGAFDRRLKNGGASTLATQIEKFRHSPAGRTETIDEKLRQMASATANAYLDGPDTIPAQERIITTYLDSTPLSARRGYGEVIGLGDGLRAWYGIDFTAANRLLGLANPPAAQFMRRAQFYKDALSLLIAQRRPTFYLNAGRSQLENLTDSYLRSLIAEGVIARSIGDAALSLPLRFTPEAPAPAEFSFVQRKAVDAIRGELMAELGVPNLYSLDRLDASADVSIDVTAQNRVTALLERLKEPETDRHLGLVGTQMLGEADPAKLAWSVVLYERGKDQNLVRIHADSLNQPFDINSGAKLILGSTAKLRTLATYLGIMDRLHAELSGASAPKLRRIAASTSDPLRKWAADYLADASPADRALQPMLEAAMQRRYSANPNKAFFTGGGVQVFQNFERAEDHERPTVEDAFEHSINLAFVRLMRDVIRHYEAESGARAELLKNPESPLRTEYLRRFADQEGRAYLNRFYDEYARLAPEATLDRLASQIRPTLRALAVVFRSVKPEAPVGALEHFLARRLPGVPVDASAAALYARYAPGKFSLDDRGYLAGIHPLELWLVAYLQRHPGATRAQVIAASGAQRQAAYAWLFKTKNIRKQDVRIRVLIEEDAFSRLLQDWKRQGYPFGRLVPSLGTVLGSSGDRPDALAKLMGIILNGGLEFPTTDIERINFAVGTPYETDMAYRPAAAKRVMAPEVAEILRHALMGVVQNGTGVKLRGAYRSAAGTLLPVGGKTGTGDNRYETFGPGHRLLESRVVDRTATFVFFLGSRFYGTVTAYVPGEQAARYHFTSALAVSLLKALMPELDPLIEAKPPHNPVRNVSD